MQELRTVYVPVPIENGKEAPLQMMLDGRWHELKQQQAVLLTKEQAEKLTDFLTSAKENIKACMPLDEKGVFISLAFHGVDEAMKILNSLKENNEARV